VKANYGTLGVSASTRRGKCIANINNDVVSLLHRAKMAGNYAHTPDRDWYSNSNLPMEAVQNGCRDIAWQLVHNTEIN
ncbi:hypothetical protein CRUP_026708, partial [Coryphaenoides rupestris]